MSVIGPEFYSFIKKLEDNGDKLTPGTPVEQPLEFEFNVRKSERELYMNGFIFIIKLFNCFRTPVAMFAMVIMVLVLENQYA